MPKNPFAWDFNGRRSIRLPGVDYSAPGTYGVTICTKVMECLLGDVRGGHMTLSGCGQIVEREWYEIGMMRPMVSLGPWVIMPNHLHGIIIIRGDDDARYITVRAHCVRPDQDRDGRISLPVGAASSRPDKDRDVTPSLPDRGARSAPLRQPQSLASLIAGFKSATTSLYQSRSNATTSLWHRNYWESIIDSDRQYDAAVEYILNNPAAWDRDELNPARK